MYTSHTTKRRREIMILALVILAVFILGLLYIDFTNVSPGFMCAGCSNL